VPFAIGIFGFMCLGSEKFDDGRKRRARFAVLDNDTDGVVTQQQGVM
jgi:hypothetical protein